MAFNIINPMNQFMESYGNFGKFLTNDNRSYSKYSGDGHMKCRFGSYTPPTKSISKSRRKSKTAKKSRRLNRN